MSNFKALSIWTQFLIIALSGILIASSSITAMYVSLTGIITQTKEDYTLNVITTLQENLSVNTNVINEILTNLCYNPTISEYINATDPIKRVELNRKINLTVSNMMNLKDGLLDFVFIGDNGSVYGYNENLEWVEKLKSNFPSMSKPYYSQLIEEPLNNSRFMIVGSEIFSIEPSDDYRRKLGEAALLIDVYALGLEVESIQIPDQMEIYVLDRDNHILFNNANRRIGEEFALPANMQYGTPIERTINGKPFLVQVESIKGIKGSIVSIVPKRSLLAESIEIGKSILLIFILAVLMLSIPFIMIIRNIVTPVNKMMKFISRMKNSNMEHFKNRINLEGNKEMTVLAQRFNGLLDQIDVLTEHLVDTSTRLYRSDLEKKKSELAYLRSQINPHFLYNTLESISGMALVSNVVPIQEMTSGLAEMFRYSIKGADSVTLREELEIVKCYTKIQQIRFGYRFNVTFDVDEEALKRTIIRMTLQPIVENAVYHGLESIMEKGHLQIICRAAQDGLLVITVADNGQGMDEETLTRIRARLKRRHQIVQDDDEEQGIGLINIADRLFFTFGENCSIDIESSLNQGTKVIVRLPAGRDLDV
jgi:two-component system sensor histidine kinase YesM